MSPRQRLTRPGELYRPDRHHPIQACARCGQPWPCTADQIAAANKTIADSLKGDAVTAYYRCVQMVTETLRELRPQTVDLQAVCAAAVGVLK